MSGDAISAAGLLVAKDGRVLAVDNRSGHYQPGYLQLKLAVEYLRANQLLEPEAFVSLYLDDSDALYLSPTDFIEVAGLGLPFPAVAAKLSARSKKYQGMPVAPNYYDSLLPNSLKPFPIDTKTGINRWDGMLLKLYSAPGADLKGAVGELTALLRTQTQPAWQSAQHGGTVPQNVSAQRWQTARIGFSAQEAEKWLQGGGAYCDLIPLIDSLITGRQSASKTAPGTDKVLAGYQTIRNRLQALKPKATIL